MCFNHGKEIPGQARDEVKRVKSGISEAEGRREGAREARRGSPLTRAPGGSRVAAGDKIELAPQTKNGQLKAVRFVLWSIGESNS